MQFMIGFAIASLSFLGSLNAAERSMDSHVNAPLGEQEVRVIPATDSLITKAAAGGEVIGRLLAAAKPTIGVPYHWGGSQLDKKIDCSNYTWQLFRKIGLPYDRYLSTQQLSTLTRANGLHKISFDDTAPGDLLVYGYRDTHRKWHGHVVILVDVDGSSTGYKGLVLGAHGGSVGEVQFVTFKGFDAGYFKDPKMRLCNVVRLDGSDEGKHQTADQ